MRLTFGDDVEAFREDVRKDELAADLEQLAALRPVCRYRPEVSARELFLPETRNAPLDR